MRFSTSKQLYGSHFYHLAFPFNGSVDVQPIFSEWPHNKRPLTLHYVVAVIHNEALQYGSSMCILYWSDEEAPKSRNLLHFGDPQQYAAKNGTSKLKSPVLQSSSNVSTRIFLSWNVLIFRAQLRSTTTFMNQCTLYAADLSTMYAHLSAWIYWHFNAAVQKISDKGKFHIQTAGVFSL